MLRLGLRLASGLSEEDGRLIAKLRHVGNGQSMRGHVGHEGDRARRAAAAAVGG
jgi:hypothetical protein